MTLNDIVAKSRDAFSAPERRVRGMTWLLIAVFVINQAMLMQAHAAMGGASFGPSAAMAHGIVMPIPNEDGMTTHLGMMPTVTPVPGEPGSGDAKADAMAVMIPTGTPFYAPDGVSFDDPVAALDMWPRYESLELPGELNDRYKGLIGVFPCNFCCGSPTSVTFNGRCGCAHAKAGRGFFTYMLKAYGAEYTDAQLMGEAYRWQAAWYPSGVVEDYLLFTDRGDVIGHKTHGGAGADGMHGMGVTN